MQAKLEIKNRTCLLFKFNLSLFSLYYAEACNVSGAHFRVMAPAGNVARSKKFLKGGKPMATLCPISPAGDLNLRPPIPDVNALRLDLIQRFIIRQFFLIIKGLKEHNN